MDSYNYENLLPGNGTGNSPIATAVWNDFSFDGNDATSTTSPTYVSVQLCFGVFCNIIRASVDALYRDGAGQISRDPRTKRHQTRRECLPKASKPTVSHSRANI